MSGEERGYGMGYLNRAFLIAVAVILFVTSFFMESGHLFFPEGNRNVSIIIGLACILLLLVSVYITSEPVVPRHQDRLIAVAFSAALIFACPGALLATPIHPAAIALLWAQFCMLKEQYFTAFFLMGISAMFFPPVLWIAVLVILFMLLAGLQDPWRNFLKFFGGLIVPYILVFGFRYLMGYDLVALGKWYAGEMISIGYDVFSLNIPMLFLVVCIALIFVHAVIKFMRNMGELGIAESYALKVQIINVAVCAAAFVLFASSGRYPVAILACCPAAVLFSRYFSQFGQLPWLRIEVVILLCALLVSRLGYFIV